MMQHMQLEAWPEEDEIATEQLILQADQLLLLRSQGASQPIEEDITLPGSSHRCTSANPAAANSIGPEDESKVDASAREPACASAAACQQASDTCNPAPSLEQGTAGSGSQGPAQPWLPDLENIGKVLDRRRFRPIGMSVTDFTAAEWCQQQFALELTLRLPREAVQTPAMAGGSELHAALEAEVKKIIQIEITSREDNWAAALLNTITSLRQLLRKGLTREVYVFGKVQGIWVKGIIDELAIDELGRVKIVEHKTRKSTSLPSQAQQQTARLQVMLYRSLLLGLAEASEGPLAAEVLQLHRLDGKAELGKEIKKHARKSGIGLVVNLEQVMACLHAAAAKLPPCNEEMQVRYLWQVNRQLLGLLDVWWDAQYLQRQVSAHRAFFEGKTAPAKVAKHEDWKCMSCMFFHACKGPHHDNCKSA